MSNLLTGEDYFGSCNHYTLKDHLECIRICKIIKNHLTARIQTSNKVVLNTQLEILKSISHFHTTGVQEYLQH